MQAHAQTEPRYLRRFILDARYASVIPPLESESREFMVPCKRCLPTPPPELVLIGCRGLEAGRGLIWKAHHFPKREAGSHPVSLVLAVESGGCSDSRALQAAAGRRAGALVPLHWRARHHRSATAHSLSLDPGVAAGGAPASSLKSLLRAATQASPGPPAGDLALCCKTATSLPASALLAVSLRDPGPDPWTWD